MRWQTCKHLSQKLAQNTHSLIGTAFEGECNSNLKLQVGTSRVSRANFIHNPQRQTKKKGAERPPALGSGDQSFLNSGISDCEDPRDSQVECESFSFPASHIFNCLKCSKFEVPIQQSHQLMGQESGERQSLSTMLKTAEARKDSLLFMPLVRHWEGFASSITCIHPGGRSR